MERKIYLFTASWCSRCKYVRENFFSDIEETCPGAKVISLTESPHYAKEYHITRIPQIVLIDENGDRVPYFGERADQLIRWYQTGSMDEVKK